MLLANLRAHGRRLSAAGLAVALGTAFLALVLAIGATFGATIGKHAAGTVGDADVVVTAAAGTVPDAVVAATRALPGASVRTQRVETVMQQLGARPGATVLQTPPTDLGPLEGRLPKAGEVVATQQAATARSMTIGARIRLEGKGTHEVTVVGIAATPRSGLAQPGLPTLLATDATIADVVGTTGVTELAARGVTPDAVRALPAAKGLVVRSGDAERAHRVDQLSAGAGALTTVFSAFAAVALFVAALVIANCFTIVLAQRAREMALLRCVGTTRGQVRRAVLGEAAVVGVVGSVLGLGLGIALGHLTVRLSAGSTLALEPLVLTPLALVLPLVVGVLVTVGSAVLPVRRAVHVAPVEALRPAAAPTGQASRRRVVLGLVVAALGTGALVLGAVKHAVGVGILGGMVSFVGVLLLGQVLVPACVGLLGVVLRRSVPGGLAVDTARRNPARTTATSSALLVGVTLITLMSVGSLSGQRTVDSEIASHAPIDLAAVASQSLTSAQVESLREVPGVRSVAAATTLRGDATASGRPLEAAQITAVDAAHADAVRVEDIAAALGRGEAVVGSDLDVADGAPVVVAGRQYRAHRSTVLGRSIALPGEGAGVRGAWIRLTDDADVLTTTEALAQRISAPGLQVSGPATQRQEMAKVADAVLAVVTGLLAVAVVIALVGIGNTLSLGVFERTRELGLLRALGMTRRSVRASIGLEALAVALVSALLGVALGIGYGAAAAHALLGSVGDVVVAVPWARLALVVLVALVAGWLASVLPARQASRVAPSVALATE